MSLVQIEAMVNGARKITQEISGVPASLDKQIEEIHDQLSYLYRGFMSTGEKGEELAADIKSILIAVEKLKSNTNNYTALTNYALDNYENTVHQMGVDNTVEQPQIAEPEKTSELAKMFL